MIVNDLLMQFQADILDRPVVRPAIKETTALGAMYAAGLAVGFYRDLDDLRANWSVDKTWTPNMPAEKRERMYACGRRLLPGRSIGSRIRQCCNGGRMERTSVSSVPPWSKNELPEAACIHHSVGEFAGTLVLILLGDGVVANVLLKRSKAEGGGWMVITTAWAFAVLCGIFTAVAFGSADAHINPAVTLAVRHYVRAAMSKIVPYCSAQLLGAFCRSDPGLAVFPTALEA